MYFLHEIRCFHFHTIDSIIWTEVKLSAFQVTLGWHDEMLLSWDGVGRQFTGILTWKKRFGVARSFKLYHLWIVDILRFRFTREKKGYMKVARIELVKRIIGYTKMYQEFTGTSHGQWT